LDFRTYFPSNTRRKGQKLKDKDKDLIIEMLGERATPKIKQLLSRKERDNEEKTIYQTALKETKSLNSIGNMCLLTDKDNISNGCGFFDEKRTNILARIRKGSFVPKHTFDVFSKMVFDRNPGDFERWTNENIQDHKSSIELAINELELINESR
jgi:predicted Zn-ribbon and HTH transcriptional regulator